MEKRLVLGDNWVWVNLHHFFVCVQQRPVFRFGFLAASSLKPFFPSYDRWVKYFFMPLKEKCGYHTWITNKNSTCMKDSQSKCMKKEKALFQVIWGLLLVYADWEKEGVCLRERVYVCVFHDLELLRYILHCDSFNFLLGWIKYIVISTTSII